ncbi:hypothetical protein [Streptomyces cylindrosporus]|uniref:Uncharacterized protein n=1 Tax=Streptomyces cylindrosporus TaxID=2927583 RepID=A0ABS9Y4D6_9ACTN|nr:hypothetical protein [Streptomyces cylindrosporus]MCI3272064.1 hypothetical protein [Streptomyces cylindrosporus]
MLVIQLVSSLLTLMLNQALQTRYGASAVLGLLLIGVGIRARSATCAGIGAAFIMLGTMTQS